MIKYKDKLRDKKMKLEGKALHVVNRGKYKNKRDLSKRRPTMEKTRPCQAGVVWSLQGGKIKRGEGCSSTRRYK